MNRRQLLGASIGAATIGLVGATPAQAAQRFPEVPGMLGDRRANEFWYEFDEATVYDISAELRAAYEFLRAQLGRWERAVYFAWRDAQAAGTYPRTFVEYVTPIRPQLAVLSRAQLGVFDAFYCRRDPRLVTAFTTFGEGVLFDPRRAPMEHEVHTMNGSPPVGYHTWHAFLRAMMLLDIDSRRWREIAPLNALAWAVQTVAKPQQRTVNPPLPRSTVRALTWKWLPRTIEQLDEDFRSFPLPAGMS
jgi:hypothetical protein